MAKKKAKQAAGEDDGGIGSQPSVPVPAAHQAQPSPSPTSRQKSRNPDATHSTAAPTSTGLAICRNKYVYGTPFLLLLPNLLCFNLCSELH